MACLTEDMMKDKELMKKIFEGIKNYKPSNFFKSYMMENIKMNEIKERLANLQEYLAAEEDTNSLYAKDLRVSIKSCENALKNGGYYAVKARQK